MQKRPTTEQSVRPAVLARLADMRAWLSDTDLKLASERVLELLADNFSMPTEEAVKIAVEEAMPVPSFHMEVGFQDGILSIKTGKGQKARTISSETIDCYTDIQDKVKEALEDCMDSEE